MPEKGAVLAFDFGKKRIGVAIGDFETSMAHPLTTVSQVSNDERFAAIEKLINEWKPLQLVVGLPLGPEGEEQEISRLARRFARRLEGRFSLPVAMVDERFSSFAAEETLREAGIRGIRQKQFLDQVAAQHILQHFLEQK